jgi:hypothetical protein
LQNDCGIPKLKLHDRQTGDHLEVAEIAGGSAAAEFQSRHLSRFESEV